MSIRVTNGLNLSSQRITSLAPGTVATDGVTLGQVLDLIRATPTKSDVRVATTANITLTAAQTIDAVAVVVGDRVLVKNQTTGAANGIYVVAAGAWTRAVDADSAAEIPGAVVGVQTGGTLGDTIWRNTNDTGAFTLDTTAVTFAQVGASAGGTIVDVLAGTGITVTGTTTKTVSIDTAVVTRKFSTTVGNASLTTLTVVHNLNTRDVLVQVRDAATPFEEVLVDNAATDANTISLTFAVAPATGAYRVTVVG